MFPMKWVLQAKDLIVVCFLTKKNCWLICFRFGIVRKKMCVHLIVMLLFSCFLHVCVSYPDLVQGGKQKKCLQVSQICKNETVQMWQYEGLCHQQFSALVPLSGAMLALPVYRLVISLSTVVHSVWQTLLKHWSHGHSVQIDRFH